MHRRARLHKAIITKDISYTKVWKAAGGGDNFGNLVKNKIA